MKSIKIALVGRPNVGKSSLFNRIVKKRISIEHEEEGVTRDRLYAPAEIFGRFFTLIDTGGMDLHSSIPFKEEVYNQALFALKESDGIILVVDGPLGILSADKEVAQLLLKAQKPVVLAVNKIDNEQREVLLHQFHELGIQDIIAVSAAQNYQIAELLESLLQKIPDQQEEIKKNPIHVAIVGQTNVGKSTLLNFLFKEPRCIVSDIPGTTRDPIDCSLIHEDQEYVFIDTAGIRRKKSEKEVVEKFASIRTRNAIKRSDLCLFVLDSQKGMSHEEKKIAALIEKEGKGCILLFNKWDLVKGFRMEHCLAAIRKEAAFLQHCPTKFVSAKMKRGFDDLFDLIQEVQSSFQTRISTPQLNRFIEDCMHKVRPPMIQGKRFRIYYMTQIETKPPKFVFFVNSPRLMCPSYQKYLINQFRETYFFRGVPLRFKIKHQRKKISSSK